MQEYEYRGSTYQFEEGAAPKDAVPVKQRVPSNKAEVQGDAKPVATKQRRPRNKSA